MEQPQCYCVRCQKMKPRKEFFPCLHKSHVNHVTYYCKDCCGDIADEQFKVNASFEYNLRNICAQLDLPYLKEIQDKLVERLDKGVKERQVNIVFNYIKALRDNLPEDKLELYWQDLSGASYFALDILKVAKPTSEGDIELLNELESDWGKLDSIYDYNFVVNKYYEYTNGEEISPSMQTTMRYLCLAELEVKKARERGDDTTKIEDKIQKYYKTLKLDDFKLSASKSTGEKCLEKWISIEESTHPLEVASELFNEDICGLKDGYNEMLRCLSNEKNGTEYFPKGLIE